MVHRDPPPVRTAEQPGRPPVGPRSVGRAAATE
ncbi:hypothetical protein JOF29_002808 [Kribbella aluminosa]|uniref:Uncharacterized protein n=1 Tax=Kribbella aluminosa TaxID=416017 RepID=A0ABS4UJ89_9ACTN|nr:hypothetical protein [Kribbella aluminosa]